jgi:hypothetical protein
MARHWTLSHVNPINTLCRILRFILILCSHSRLNIQSLFRESISHPLRALRVPFSLTWPLIFGKDSYVNSLHRETMCPNYSVTMVGSKVCPDYSTVRYWARRSCFQTTQRPDTEIAGVSRLLNGPILRSQVCLDCSTVRY